MYELPETPKARYRRRRWEEGKLPNWDLVAHESELELLWDEALAQMTSEEVEVDNFEEYFGPFNKISTALHKVRLEKKHRIARDRYRKEKKEREQFIYE